MNFASPFRSTIRLAGHLAVACLLSAGGLRGASVTDSDITFAIERAFQRDPTVPANEIDVTTADGIVTLAGRVDRLLERVRAVKLVEAVEGVRSVVNTIRLEMPERSDAAVLEDVRAALTDDPATDSYEIVPTVVNGTVNLAGTVPTWRGRQLAMHVARSVRGVTAVSSELGIAYESIRPDAQIKADVERVLETDIWVRSPDGIEVDVREGTVVLIGEVNSVIGRNRAIEDAWVAGTTEVVADDLTVRPWAFDGRRDTLSAARSDEWIEEAVNDALTRDPRVSGFNVQVSVSDAVVTLAGTVDNLKAKSAAASTASDTVGVWRVENFLKVRPASIVPDEVLVPRLKAALARNEIESAPNIDVSARKGVVTLTGVVDNRIESAEAEEVVQRTNGVVAVRNRLLVSSPMAVYPNYPYDTNLDFDPASRDRRVDDVALKGEIESEFLWSPFVSGSDIEVVVDGGVATLTGTVDSWAEYRAAEENAREGGALSVVNKLTVE